MQIDCLGKFYCYKLQQNLNLIQDIQSQQNESNTNFDYTQINFQQEKKQKQRTKPFHQI